MQINACLMHKGWYTLNWEKIWYIRNVSTKHHQAGRKDTSSTDQLYAHWPNSLQTFPNTEQLQIATIKKTPNNSNKNSKQTNKKPQHQKPKTNPTKPHITKIYLIQENVSVVVRIWNFIYFFSHLQLSKPRCYSKQQLVRL